MAAPFFTGEASCLSPSLGLLFRNMRINGYDESKPTCEMCDRCFYDSRRGVESRFDQVGWDLIMVASETRRGIQLGIRKLERGSAVVKAESGQRKICLDVT